MLFIASFLFTFQVCTTRFNNKNEVFWIFVCLVEDGALKRALSFQQPGRGLTPPPPALPPAREWRRRHLLPRSLAGCWGLWDMAALQPAGPCSHEVLG